MTVFEVINQLYNLIRTFIFKNKTLNKLNIQIYDDDENELHLEVLMKINVFAF